MTNRFVMSSAIALTNLNPDSPDSATCGSGTLNSCSDIICEKCPLDDQNVCLGDVRKEVAQQAAKVPTPDDGVRQPSHYQVFPGLESIEVIARSMTESEFRGFCMGNTLKYRMRAGKKSDLASIEKDLAKADFYKELFEQHKGKCYVTE